LIPNNILLTHQNSDAFSSESDPYHNVKLLVAVDISNMQRLNTFQKPLNKVTPNGLLLHTATTEINFFKSTSLIPHARRSEPQKSLRTPAIYDGANKKSS